MLDRVVGVTYVTSLTAELLDHTAIELVGSSEAIPHVKLDGVVGVAERLSLTSEVLDHTGVKLVYTLEAIPHVKLDRVVGVAGGADSASQPLDRAAVKLVDALNLLGGEEIAKLLVVLLANGEELFTTLEVVLDGTLGLGICSYSLRCFVPRGECPDLLLLLGIELYEPAGGGFVEAELLGDVSSLDSAQALT
jgi:hypothetical protein